MLNASRNREPLTRRSGALTMLAVLALAAPLAAVTLTERTQDRGQRIPGDIPSITAGARDVVLVARAAPAPEVPAQPSRTSTARPAAAPAAAAASAARQQTPGALSGTIRDASGAVLPGVLLTLTDTTTGSRASAVTDGIGMFRFRDLSPGKYELLAALPGFATVSNVLDVAPGQSLDRALVLRIGMLQERILVTCASGAAAIPAPADRLLGHRTRPASAPLFTMPREAPRATAFAMAQGTPVRVGGQIRVPRKTRDAHPVCPSGLLPSPDGTVVTLEATIGVDGYMNDVRSLGAKSGDAPPVEFVESAIEGVRQWRYSPALLNNVAVPVIVSITVEYRRM
jgi:hypothetical protein